MNSISANLNVMIKACEKASKILIRDFGELEKLQVSKKGPRDFVTNSDVKAEKIIIEELKKARPNYSIISEENGVENNKDINEILSEAIQVAEKGMQSTKDLLATKGRASFLGERAKGHIDPGARSSQLMIKTVCESVIHK